MRQNQLGNVTKSDAEFTSGKKKILINTGVEISQNDENSIATNPMNKKNSKTELSFIKMKIARYVIRL